MSSFKKKSLFPVANLSHSFPPARLPPPPAAVGANPQFIVCSKPTPATSYNSPPFSNLTTFVQPPLAAHPNHTLYGQMMIDSSSSANNQMISADNRHLFSYPNQVSHKFSQIPNHNIDNHNNNNNNTHHHHHHNTFKFLNGSQMNGHRNQKNFKSKLSPHHKRNNENSVNDGVNLLNDKKSWPSLSKFSFPLNADDEKNAHTNKQRSDGDGDGDNEADKMVKSQKMAKNIQFVRNTIEKHYNEQASSFRRAQLSFKDAVLKKPEDEKKEKNEFEASPTDSGSIDEQSEKNVDALNKSKKSQQPIIFEFANLITELEVKIKHFKMYFYYMNAYVFFFLTEERTNI